MWRFNDTQADAVTLLSENLRSYDLMLHLAEETRKELLAGNMDALAEKCARRRRLEREICARDQIIEQVRPRLAGIPLDDRVSHLVKRSMAAIARIQQVDRKTWSLMLQENERPPGP
jgi:hypothetical protein